MAWQAKANGLDGRAGVATAEAPVVLLVEDHADTRWITARLLRANGFQVVTAEGLAEAMEVVAERSIDLLVSDIGLPDGTGYDVVRRVREIRPAVRAIAVSGYGMDEDVRESLRAGFDVHLTKPVAVDRLIDAVRALVV
jgi:CheY-like chemotaxis protein